MTGNTLYILSPCSCFQKLLLLILVFFVSIEVHGHAASFKEDKTEQAKINIEYLIEKGKSCINKTPEKAIVYLDEALVLADKNQLRNKASIINLYLSEAYEKLGNYKASLVYYRKFCEIHESLNDSSKAISADEIGYSHIQRKENGLLKKNLIQQDELIVKQFWVIILISMILIAFGVLMIILIRENRTVSKLNATKQKFFSIITHDLRNPFHSIMGGTKLLIEEEDEFTAKERKAFLEKIYETSRITYTLLENLLQWSRSQTDVIEFSPFKISLKELLDRNVSLAKTAIDAKEIQIKTVIDDAIRVYVDEFMIDAVVRNLLSNAVKFTSKGGRIIIEAEPENKKIIFSINDNGIGIPKENLSRVFEIDKFFSTEGTMNEKGSGIGLLLCKEFITRHKEKIWVESEIGKGTTFYFTMPSVH